MPLTLGGALVAWTAPAATAGVLFGLFFVARNAADGIPWTSPAIFCGIPAAAFLAAASIAAGLAYAVVRAAGWRASTKFFAALSAFVFFSIVGFQSIREYKVDVPWRYLTGGALGAIAALATAGCARSRVALAMAKGSIAAGAVALLTGALAVASVHFPRGKGGEERDPRDFVSTFAPLDKRPERDPEYARVIVLGLDGVTWDKIDPRIARGELANFARLRAEGSTARLRTIVPTASPSIWTTFVTGVLPAEHRIQDFVVRRAAFLPSHDLAVNNRTMRRALASLGLHSVTPVSSNLRFSKALWNIATEMDISSLTVGWWASYPAETVKGWIVSDAVIEDWEQWFLTTKEKGLRRSLGATYPEELAAEIAPLRRSLSSLTREELGQFLVVDDDAWAEFRAHVKVDRNKPMSIFPSSYLREEFLLDVTTKLDDEHRPEIVLCYTRLTDDVGHFFWEYSETEDAKVLGLDPKLVSRYGGVVDNSYSWADGVVGRFLARLGPKDTLVVVSDHGWERVGLGQYHHSNGPDGIIAFFGAFVKPGRLASSPHILDVMPTLLYLAGIPKGKEMPGRAVREAFTLTREERTIPTWDTVRFGTLEAIQSFDSDARVNLLRQVGYVEGGHGK